MATSSSGCRAAQGSEPVRSEIGAGVPEVISGEVDVLPPQRGEVGEQGVRNQIAAAAGGVQCPAEIDGSLFAGWIASSLKHASAGSMVLSEVETSSPHDGFWRFGLSMCSTRLSGLHQSTRDGRRVVPAGTPLTAAPDSGSCLLSARHATAS